ncbi:MAG: DUF5119 domain-containing protein [Bacteroidaceae bacterium]|nr:DUF5119 domain-containing protein [Bacteroidaceae bacterium]
MNKMNRFLPMLALFLGVALTSCEQKDLCFDHDAHTPRVEFKFNFAFDRNWEENTENYIDWKNNWSQDYDVAYDELRPAEAEGIRMHAYYGDTPETMRNMTVEKSSVRLSNEGYYDFLFYNNDTEYIVFEGLNTFATAYATTRGLVRSSYKGNPLMTRATEEVTVNPPDMLYGSYKDSVYATRSFSVDTMDITMHPLVFKYLVRFEVTKGAEHVVQAKGALAGMAKGVNLSNGRTTQDIATVLFDCDWVGDYGVQALVKSFGLPNYPNINYTRATNYQVGLSIELRLKNGNFQQHDFDITDQVIRQPHGGVIVVSGIEIDEDRDDSGGGFQVGVDGWGDEVNVPLPI